MKERPILFSAPMVRAILAGTKTQTRRVVKRQPADLWPDGVECYSDARGPFRVDLANVRVRLDDNGLSYDAACCFAGPIACSYGQPGDRLWVRETGWERPERSRRMLSEGADTWVPFYYDADGWDEQDHADFKAWGFKRRPSIHMPRWASRILLEIVSVRVERLQEISAQDAVSEGVTQQMRSDMGWAAEESEETFNARQARSTFGMLWESINGAGSWAANPFVWVVEFKRVTP